MFNVLQTILLVSTFFCFSVSRSLAQTQTVRGTVVDKIAQSPIPGATIVVLNSEPVLHAVSDDEGSFSLAAVPVGQHSFLIRYSGYKEVVLQNISVNAGKE